jgi:proton glutamate symport protein
MGPSLAATLRAMSDPKPLPKWLPQTLTQWIGVAVIAGVTLGLLSHQNPALASSLAPLAFFGELFIKCLKLLIIPVIVTSLVVGVTSIGDLGRLGRLGGKAVLYYGGTTASAAVLGLILVNVLQPGIGVSGEGADVPDKAQAGAGMTVGSMLGRIFGETLLNPLQSLRDGDVLTVIAACLLFGLVLIVAGDASKPVVDLFKKADAVIMQVVRNVMWVAPLGVLGLLHANLAKGGLDALVAVGKYCVTVTLGLGIHGLIVLPAIVLLIGKMAPRRWIRGIRPAVAVAFSTSSSSATLPVTIEACEDNLDVPTEVASFVLPLGATMNMDGTALYEAIAALFVAQVFGIDLTIVEQIVVFATAMAASVGAAGIPSAGLVTMAMVFEAVGLPLEGIGLILAVDRFLDMGRTVVNVMGDTAGAVVLARLTRTEAA